jgi:cyclic pyranopterin monophosphate synthase
LKYTSTCEKKYKCIRKGGLNMVKLTHIDPSGRGRMVDVSEKDETKRVAVAQGKISMSRETLLLIKEGSIGKGDVLGVAQTAGIMAAKQTGQLIPMCHPLFLTGINMEFNFLEHENAVEIKAQVSTVGKTGVEMEALTAVSVAALTVYDMCKAVDKNMVISNIYLQKKTGGKSGNYTRKEKV